VLPLPFELRCVAYVWPRLCGQQSAAFE